MPEPRKENRWLFWTVAGIAAPVLSVPLYVLSVGPVVWLAKRGYIPWDVAVLYERPIYLMLKPLEPSILEFWESYMRWWMP